MEELANTQAVESTDNSSIESDDFNEQIIAALEGEPDKQQDDATEEEKTEELDNVTECPEKFLNKDGSVNISNMVKSYKELEPLLNKKAEWEKERAELLQYKERLDAIEQQQNEQQQNIAAQKGYDSIEDMQLDYEIANFEANEYAKYLNYIDLEDRDTVRDMLYRYSQNPNEELMKDIELEFSPDINKKIAIQSYQLKQAHQQQLKEYENTQKLSNIEGVIKASVEEYNELLNYEPINNLFVSTLQKYGDNFTFEDSKVLMDALSQMKEIYKNEFVQEYGIKTENDKVTDKLASISGNNSAPATDNLKLVDDMSEKEMSDLISKYV